MMNFFDSGDKVRNPSCFLYKVFASWQWTMASDIKLVDASRLR